MHVGEALQNIRISNDLSVEEFSYNILLAPEELIEIEIGNRQPEPETLSLISNLYNLEITKLEQGQIMQRPSRNELFEAMQEISEDIKRIKEDNKYFRNFIEKWGLHKEMKEKRYQAKDITEEIGEIKESEYDYAIFDTLTGKYITEPDGSIKTWEYGIDAQRIANAMNQEPNLEAQNVQLTNAKDFVQSPSNKKTTALEREVTVNDEYPSLEDDIAAYLEQQNAEKESHKLEQNLDVDEKKSPLQETEDQIVPKI